MIANARIRLVPSFLLLAALLAWAEMPDRLSPAGVLRARETLRNDLPSRADTERMERGYYEQILDAGRDLARLGAAGNADRGVPVALDGAGDDSDVTRRVEDVREFVMRPNLVRGQPAQIPWSTNDRGMRDRAYRVDKPAGTFRVAMAGDSIGMGWRVDDHEGFEPRLERLWDERSRASGGPTVEFLNFAVPGHGPGQRWTHFEATAWETSPDLVIFEATPADIGWDERRLRGNLARGLGFDAPVYRDTLAAAGIPRGLTSEAYRRLLRPLRWSLIEGVYRNAVASCRSRAVPCVFVLIPRVGKPIDPAERETLLDLARRAGFDAVLDVTDAYRGADPATLAVSPEDFHPNAEGHARIASALDAAFTRLDPRRLPTPWTGAVTTHAQDEPRGAKTAAEGRGAETR